jgi:hypothetical protein
VKRDKIDVRCRENRFNGRRLSEWPTASCLLCSFQTPLYLLWTWTHLKCLLRKSPSIANTVGTQGQRLQGLLPADGRLQQISLNWHTCWISSIFLLKNSMFRKLYLIQLSGKSMKPTRFGLERKSVPRKQNHTVLTWSACSPILKTEAVSSSETAVNFYQNTQCHISIATAVKFTSLTQKLAAFWWLRNKRRNSLYVWYYRKRTGWPTGITLRLVFGRCSVRISTWTQIFLYFLLVFFSPYKQIPEEYLE